MHLASWPLPTAQWDAGPKYNPFLGGVTLNYLEYGGPFLHTSFIILNGVIKEFEWISV